MATDVKTTHEETGILRLSHDLKIASETFESHEARFLVDTYYEIQEYRKSSKNQLDALSKSDEPHETLGFFHNQFMALETDISKALDVYSDKEPMGRWARQVVGIGPVISAGLIAHIDINKAPTAGAIWRFAGLDPSVVWGKGEKRPYNAKLKVLMWKIGDSFVKLSNHDQAFYGHMYKDRKEFEVIRDNYVQEVDGPGWYAIEVPTLTKDKKGNYLTKEVNNQPVEINGKWFVGGNAKAAAETLNTKNIKKPETLAIYRSGHLPAGRLDLRARRVAVKMFISHWHEEAYFQMGKKPPVPYALTMDEHTHYIASPVPSLGKQKKARKNR